MSIRSEKINSFAEHLGFSFCGIAKAEPLFNHKELNEDFIRKKLHQSFSYLENNLEKRLDPFKIMPDVKSVIAVLLNYYPDKIIPEEDNFVISKYAYGKDYHSIMKKTNELADFIKEEFGRFTSLPDPLLKERGEEALPIKAQAFVDSGSVMEKVWAERCGVGWQGKNTLLINKTAGSFFFIGIILTNFEIEPDQPETDHCGTCDKCMKACPTGALEQPYRLTISRCIAYHTIENKQPIPEELRGKFHDRIFGCDICQDVCPFNKFAKPSKDPEFKTPEALTRIRKKDWMGLTEDQFGKLFRETTVKRTGYQHFMRNIRFVSGVD